MAPARKKKAAKVDPISARARALNEQISTLEAEIKKLDTQIQRAPVPKFRSTAIPHGETVLRKSESPAPKPISHEPVFEEINKKTLQAHAQTEAADRYNELGVRKYDLPALWHRLRDHLRRPTTTNPRLVNYLAAGGVHGLRPMRYEKRVARNRFIALVIILFLILLGVISLFVRNH
jgi:cell division protein FtsB